MEYSKEGMENKERMVVRRRKKEKSAKEEDILRRYREREVDIAFQ